MNKNKMIMAAGILASASAVNTQAQYFTNDIKEWFENDFVDFWEKDFVGAFEDLGHWFETDFVDFWEEDFVDFWEKDFVDFWADDLPNFFTETIPSVLELTGIEVLQFVTLGNSDAVIEWFENDFVDAFEDLGDWFSGDFVDFFENDFVEFWEEDFVNFMADDFADFWSNQVPCFMLGFCHGFQKQLLQPEKNTSQTIVSYGKVFNTVDEEKELSDKDLIALKAYKALMETTEETCAVFQPKVGQKGNTGYNYTSDLFYEMGRNGTPINNLIKLMVPAGNFMDDRSCESVDCMHPCYGTNQFGACSKCFRHMIAHAGERHSLCDLCVL